jgi:hypothetical protein
MNPTQPPETLTQDLSANPSGQARTARAVFCPPRPPLYKSGQGETPGQTDAPTAARKGLVALPAGQARVDPIVASTSWSGAGGRSAVRLFSDARSVRCP